MQNRTVPQWPSHHINQKQTDCATDNSSDSIHESASKPTPYAEFIQGTQPTLLQIYKSKQWERTQTKHIDSVAVDYRDKTFELMRKNTELELNIRQSRYDVQALEKEVKRLTSLMSELLGAIESNAVIRNSDTRHEVRNKVSEEQSTTAEWHMRLASGLINRHNRSRSHSQSIAADGSNVDKIASSRQVHSTAQDAQENATGCSCGEHYEHIIQQYKSIIETQHGSIMGQKKKNKDMSRQIQSYQQRIDELIRTNCEFANNTSQLKHEINQLLESNRALVSEIAELNKSKDKSTKQTVLMQTQLQAQQDQLQAQQSQIDTLRTHNEEIFREKEKIKHKYKQEIIHFEEMQKLVQQKLIEVEYEMNFYKKERVENFAKISKLETQLKEFANSEQKKYYSFGDNSKDISIQTDLESFSEQVSEAELVIRMDKCVITKPQFENVQAKKLNRSSLDDINEQNSKQEEKNQLWKIECYEESIKTLLNENNRLKQTLINFYKAATSSAEQSQQKIDIDEQTEIELNIMMSTMQQQQSQSKSQSSQANSYAKKLPDEQSHRGRKFIKEL